MEIALPSDRSSVFLLSSCPGSRMSLFQNSLHFRIGPPVLRILSPAIKIPVAIPSWFRVVAGWTITRSGRFVPEVRKITGSGALSDGRR